MFDFQSLTAMGCIKIKTVSAFFCVIEAERRPVQRGGRSRRRQHVLVSNGCLKILAQRMKLAMVAVEQTIQTNQDLRQNQDTGEKEMQLELGFVHTIFGAPRSNLHFRGGARLSSSARC